jgi:hypothetical protein
VCGKLELPLHLRSRQPAGLQLTYALGIGPAGGLSRFPLFLLTLFHPLGEAGFRVDESFSGITHAQIRLQS